MSLFTWFSKKSSAKAELEAQSSGLGHVDATVPYHPFARGRSKTPEHPGSPGNRKGERLERRELLYSVVRESMTMAGILSSSYKFKVLSLDSRGVKYLIMMDLSRQFAEQTNRLAEMESLIAQNAKTRHDILVTAVYWRVNETVTAGLSKASASVSAPAPLSPIKADKPAVPGSVKPLFEPLQADEVAAFKKALATKPQPLSAPGEIIKSGRRNPLPEPAFENTELDLRHSPLSGTQYGDLN
jgi:hypothetical protein